MEKKATKDKGEFVMLAVHSKASFVMSLEHRKNFDAQDKKNYLKFLKKMKEIDEQKYKGVASPDNKR